MRYVIKDADGGYYSDNKIVRSEDRIEVVNGAKTVVTHAMLKPIFKGREKNDALKYHDAQSPLDMMTHVDLDDPDAFKGAVVEEFPFDAY